MEYRHKAPSIGDALSIKAKRMTKVALLGVAFSFNASHAEAQVSDIPAATTPPRPYLPADNQLSSSCDKNKGLTVSLRGNEAVGLNDKEPYTVIVKSCRKIGRAAYKNVRLELNGPNAQKKVLKTKELRPRRSIQKQVRFIFSKTSQKPEISSTLTTTNKKDETKIRQIQHWSLRYKNLGTSGGSPYNITPVMPEECHPRDDFYVGIGDNKAFVFADSAEQETALTDAKRELGATALRINLIYSEVKQYGYEQYIKAIETAKKQGYEKFHITIMPDPVYMSYLNGSYNYANPDPTLAADFAADVARNLVPFGVTSISISNEPNHPYFLASRSFVDYKAVAIASYNAIKALYPAMPIYLGELAPGDVESWIQGLNTLPNDGIALHPYFAEMAHIAKYSALAKTKLIVTEYGNPSSDPEQKNKNTLALKVSQCIGAEAIYYYMLYKLSPFQNPNGSLWDTGVLQAPGTQ